MRNSVLCLHSWLACIEVRLAPASDPWHADHLLRLVRSDVAETLQAVAAKRVPEPLELLQLVLAHLELVQLRHQLPQLAFLVEQLPVVGVPA